MGFSNRDRLRTRMKAVPAKVRRALRAQAEINARELVATQKRFAPEDTGFLIGNITATNVSDSTRISWKIEASALHARWVEFGTAAKEGDAPRQNRNYRRTAVLTTGSRGHAATPAHPFFYPAYRLLKRRFSARLTRAVKKALKDT